MPLYCSTTGSTALREAEVQQPMIAATLSLTSSFLAFSAKVGQSLAPSSWMNLILRPRIPPVAPVSVTARPVVLIAEVAGASAKDGRGSMVKAGIAAIPISSLRRNADCRPLFVSSDMSTPFGSRTRLLVRQGLLTFVHCTD